MFRSRSSATRFYQLLSLLGLSLLALGCKETQAKTDASSSAAPSAVSAPPLAAANGDAAAQGGGIQVAPNSPASYDEEAFTLQLLPPEQLVLGAVEFRLKLTPKSGFKVNVEYPIKFSFANSEGWTPVEAIVRPASAAVLKTGADFALPVKLEKAGHRVVAGKLAFSVCTADRCLIEKRDLSVTFELPGSQ